MTETLRKTAYEDRLFDVELGEFMRRSDEADASGTNSVDLLNRTGSTAVTDPTSSDISIDKDVMTFMLSGGEADTRYTVRLRWQTTGTPTQNLEALVNLEVS